jgi:hypothetical protein
MLRRVRKQVIDKMVGGGIPLPYEVPYTPEKRTRPVEERNKIAEQVQLLGAKQALDEKNQSQLGAREVDTKFMRGRGMTGGAMTGGMLTGGAMTGGAMTGGAMTGGMYGRVLGGAKCSCMEGSGITGGAQCGGAKKRGRPKKAMLARTMDEELVGSGFWSDFADGFMSVVKPVASVAKAIAPSPVGSVLSAIGLGKKKGRKPKQSMKSKEDEKLGMEVKGLKDKLGLTKEMPMKGAKKSRAEIVKEVMKKHGLKMIEASKYVKEHGLY